MNAKFTESDVEEAALIWLAATGYTILHGPEIAPEQPSAERASYKAVLLLDRLRGALVRLNPDLPAAAIDEAVRRLGRFDSPNLYVNNHELHKLLIDGAPVSYQQNGRTVYKNARVLDFDRRPAARTTIGWPSTSSRSRGWARRPTPARSLKGRGAPTSCSSSTACRWPCWS